MKLLILTMVLFLCSNCSQKSNTSNVTSPKNDTISLAYSSLSLFLDSIMRTDQVSFFSIDSYKIEENNFSKIKSANYNISITRKGVINQVRFELKKKADQNSDRNCFEFLSFENKLFDSDTLKCFEDFKQVSKSYFSFDNWIFFAFKAGATVDCNGSNCRGNSYAIFSKKSNISQLFTFRIPDDITGLKYGDLNKDNNLDLLIASNSIDYRYTEKVSNSSMPICNNMECYTFNFMTFRNGEWELLKDQKSKPFFIVIRVNEVLNPNTSFKIIDSYLP